NGPAISWPISTTTRSLRGPGLGVAIIGGPFAGTGERWDQPGLIPPSWYSWGSSPGCGGTIAGAPASDSRNFQGRRAMTRSCFNCVIEDLGEGLAGPWRGPRQMLAAQEYDSHASIHDDATAKALGFKGGAIEGPTHFSQFAPLGEAV